MSFTVGTQNMRHGTAQPRNFATIVHRQEQDTKGAHERLARKRRYWHTPNPSASVEPREHLTISGRKRSTRLVKTGWVKVHNGIHRETPTRGIRWALIEVDRRYVLSINIWPINGSWKPAKFGVREARWRFALWTAYVSALTVLLETLTARYPDAEVVVAGDANLPSALDLPGLRLVARNGVDHIYVSRGLRKRRVWRLPRWGSDHRPLKVRLTWRPR